MSSVQRTIFFTQVMVKIYAKVPGNLVVVNMYCQSLGLSLHQGTTLPNSRYHSLFTSYVRLGIKFYAKLESKLKNFKCIECCCECFALDKFKSSLKHPQVFFTSVFKSAFFMKPLERFM